MQQIWVDLLRAVGDLGLELFLTALLLMALFYAGGWLRGWSLRKQFEAEQLRLKQNGWRVRTTKQNYDVNFWQGISTELFGAVITTFAFGVVLLVFQQYSAIQNRQSELILQMGSPDNGFAIEAVRQLRAEGWLDDGTVAGANLPDADLTGANLRFANLTGANLRGADLVEAELWFANLTRAELWFVDLTGANLASANLTNANLVNANLTDVIFNEYTILPDGTNWTPNTNMAWFTDLEHPEWTPVLIGADLVVTDLTDVNLANVNLTWAYLWNANLTNANLANANLTWAYLWDANLTNANLANADLAWAYLWDANLTNANLANANLTDAYLENANLTDAILNESTILPDGTNWTPDTDMARFTDPEYPDFWDPCVEITPSPLYCD